MTFDKTKAMRNAEKYLSQGKIKSAIGEYEQVVRYDPRDFGTINMLGDLYSKNADVRKAVKCYAAVAEHYAKQGFAQKAIAVYNKISRLEPSSVEVWKKLAELYRQKGSVGEARAKYQQVAQHYEKAGQKIEALAMWKEIAQLDPTDTESYLSLADAYLAERQFDDAFEAYSECGNRLSKKGLHEGALAAFDKALSIKKDVPTVLAGLVKAFSSLGRAKESAERLSEILAEFPHSREIRMLLIDCLMEAGEIAQAEKTLVRLVEMEPANYPKFLELARLYLDKGDTMSATRILSMSSEHMLVGGQAEQFNSLVCEVLRNDAEQLEALRLQARYCSWQRDEEALCLSLTKLAKVARDADSVEDERFALLQLTMLVPHDVEYSDRLREINLVHGFDASDQEDNLFDKRFLKDGLASPNGDLVVSVVEAAVTADMAARPEPFEQVQYEGSEFVGHVAEANGQSAEHSRLQKEIDSIRFYIENGYLELAEKAVNELRVEFGERAEIVEVFAELGSVNAIGSTDGTPSRFENSPVVQVVERPGFDPQDLASELGFEDSGSADASDYETHFNTAVAYQEMGLIEEAIKEFQSAVSLVQANDGTRRFFACANLLGHCFMQQAMPHLAEKWYERSLETNDLTKDEKQGVWYELAAAYEAGGDLERAGRYYEQVYAENVNFRDVSERVRSFALNH